MQHNIKEYQLAVFKGYIIKPPPPGSQLRDITNIKPSISSVDFRRHGREVSVTVNGDNLWFCYHIQVAQYKTKVKARETSQHSLQFNYDPENDSRIPTDAGHVRVVLTSQFSNPVKQSETQVSRKVLGLHTKHSCYKSIASQVLFFNVIFSHRCTCSHIGRSNLLSSLH